MKFFYVGMQRCGTKSFGDFSGEKVFGFLVGLRSIGIISVMTGLMVSG